MPPKTTSEKILGSKSGTDARAGDIVLCEPDLVLGTDGSTPMAIDLFEQMGGRGVRYPERVILSRDHYAPATTNATRQFHDRMEAFANQHGISLLSVDDGIGFSVALEAGMVSAGSLVVGADSHTVTCGAAGAFACGIGSTDLAAVFLTGEVWLRVPETSRVVLQGALPHGVTPKDLALELVSSLGIEGANYQTIEFIVPEERTLTTEGREIVSNLAAETGAKAAVFPTGEWASDEGSGIVSEILIDCGTLQPLVATPHDPASGLPVGEVAGTSIDRVFLGTCTGGHAQSYREALDVLDAGNGVAQGVTLVVTPPTRSVRLDLERDGTLQRLEALGATVTETGCGACCGTSGPIPHENTKVLSTANRNFRGRMGEPTANIYLGSHITCAAAAATGRLVDPREIL